MDKVWGYCEDSGICGRTVTLKVKFANFQQITRSRTGLMQIRTRSELEQLGNALLEPLFPARRAFGSWVSPCPHLRWNRSKGEPGFGLKGLLSSSLSDQT